VTGRLLAITVLLALTPAANACRFAQDAQPAQWYEWSSSLFAADVASVEPDKQKSEDVITVQIVETFTGPAGAAATLRVPSRMWASCGLVRPQAGARVLVALNPNSDTLLVPLTESYSQRLRPLRAKPQPTPPAPAQSGEKPFSY
jgi:hypothetical protein